ncbi:MAG: 2-oxoglutarate dehydrogenase complex dihydrolipoyllysine-residue succinyltransferase, partial [Rickettsiales bacterium]|nr:2-oxoglutarate dehydrogenase complex dihydrolipoyllysine-residue succinyltransferase [Rickettsiales bacterium]
MVAIVVPSLGESVTSATIAKWFKKPGEAVKKDEPLVELETDKVTMEVNAPESGVLVAVAVQEGASVDIGATLGEIDPKGTPTAVAAAAPAPSPQPSPRGGEGAVASSQQPATSDQPQNPPSVTKMLAENPQVNAANVAATGKDGRLTKGDVLSALTAPAPVVAAQQAPSAPRVTGPREERVKMTKLRAAIARRLKESQNTAAILTTFNDIDMTNCMALRSEYKDHVEKKYGIRLGFMGFFVKAAVQALKEIPEVNAQIDGDSVIYKNYYDIGVAVGTEQGLVVPVVRNADQLTMIEIEAEIARLAKKARDGQLSMADMSGGTFTVSNGGVYGSLMSTPIINPPQSGILGMHRTEERPVAIKGQVVIRPMMYVALSY